jgi:hypothetical protein
MDPKNAEKPTKTETLTAPLPKGVEQLRPGVYVVREAKSVFISSTPPVETIEKPARK